MSRTFNKTCEDCGEKYETVGNRQKQCDPCWGKAMGAVRVEYLPSNNSTQLRRKAIIVCGECGDEYATSNTNQKHPGLCAVCSARTPEALAKMAAARLGKKRKPYTPEARANMAEAQRGKKRSPETRAKMAAAKRGRKHTPEHRAKIAAARAEEKRRGIAQGGKYGWLYVVSGPGQVKVGASMDEKTLAGRLASHAGNGLTEVHATWQVDPEHGSRIEAAAVAAALAEWEQVGTTIRPDGGTETVWCDAPEAIVALVEEIIAAV